MFFYRIRSVFWLFLFIGIPVIPAEKAIARLLSINALQLTDGMKIEIVCGPRTRVFLKGPGKENVKVTIGSQTLYFSYETPLFGSKTGDDVWVRLTLDHLLQNITLDSGVRATVPACAIDPNRLTVTALHGAKGRLHVNAQTLMVTIDSGAEADIKGKVENLTLSMQGGAKFNTTHKKLAIQQANITLSRGATAYLCNAAKVSGSVDYGSKVYLNKKVTPALTASHGGVIDQNHCE